MTTGLEPVTSGVTGRRSDQLNYATMCGYYLPSSPKLLPSEFPCCLLGLCPARNC